MSLVNCPECGKQISDKATTCPHCGFPVSSIPICIKCGKQLPNDVETCLNCGCPIAPQLQNIGIDNLSQPQLKSKPLILCLIALASYIVVCVLACCPHYADYTGDELNVEIGICYSVCSLVLIFLTPTLRDYLVCTIINIVICNLAFLLSYSLVFFWYSSHHFCYPFYNDYNICN